jgi:ParB-like chromosome segregation protein Spo0J
LNGVLVPVKVDKNGILLDGQHRIRAWREVVEEGHELPEIPVEVVDTDDPMWQELPWGP